MPSVNWKKHNESGTMGTCGKTHKVGVNGKTCCNREIPKKQTVEVEYFDSDGYVDCKLCSNYVGGFTNGS